MALAWSRLSVWAQFPVLRQLDVCNLGWPSWGWEVHLDNKPAHLLGLKLCTFLLCCIALEVVKMSTVCNNTVKFVLLAAC